MAITFGVMEKVSNMARRGAIWSKDAWRKKCGGAQESWMLASGGWKLDATEI